MIFLYAEYKIKNGGGIMSFIQKVAEGAKQISNRAKDLSGVAGDKAKDLTKKSSDLLELTRMKHELRKLEREMDNNLSCIGALNYQQQTGQDNVEEELKRLIEATRELDRDMKQLEEQIAAMQPKAPTCPKCTKEVSDSANFCENCGYKLGEYSE